MTIWLAGGPGILAHTGPGGQPQTSPPHRACRGAADESSLVNHVPLPDRRCGSPVLLISALGTCFSSEVGADL